MLVLLEKSSGWDNFEVFGRAAIVIAASGKDRRIIKRGIYKSKCGFHPAVKESKEKKKGGGSAIDHDAAADGQLKDTSYSKCDAFLATYNKFNSAMVPGKKPDDYLRIACKGPNQEAKNG